jgi:hypothetical protein
MFALTDGLRDLVLRSGRTPAPAASSSGVLFGYDITPHLLGILAEGKGIT